MKHKIDIGKLNESLDLFISVIGTTVKVEYHFGMEILGLLKEPVFYLTPVDTILHVFSINAVLFVFI